MNILLRYDQKTPFNLFKVGRTKSVYHRCPFKAIDMI